jgi:hypothetical protein
MMGYKFATANASADYTILGNDEAKYHAILEVLCKNHEERHYNLKTKNMMPLLIADLNRPVSNIMFIVVKLSIL